jgi:hypothetical protein
MSEFKYSIIRLDYDADTGAVIEATFKVELSKNGPQTIGSVSFLPDTGSENFVQYSNLTEELVLLWVKEKIDCMLIESNLRKQADSKASKLKSGFPWKAIK